MSILVINAGSSSVKFALFEFDSLDLYARGLLDWAGSRHEAMFTLDRPGAETESFRLAAPDYRRAVTEALSVLLQRLSGEENRAIRVVGHRLIHAGTDLPGPVWLDAETKHRISQFAYLAPLHIPAGLQAIEAAEESLPGIRQMGVFDTAYFANIPPWAYLYPVPYEWFEKWGIRRLGYHGTSHQYCAERAAEMLGRPLDQLRLVICHLGQGCSATAIRHGKPLLNTLGFSPLDGLMMGTRSGAVDPGIITYVQKQKGLSADEVERILYRESGLLGISGVSSDVRRVAAAAEAGHERARLALQIFAFRVRAAIGALIATAGGLDAVVLTGGVSENAPQLRAEILHGLQALGMILDPEANAACRPDADVARAESPARILVIRTREDYMIARQAQQMIRTSGSRRSSGNRLP